MNKTPWLAATALLATLATAGAAQASDLRVHGTVHIGLPLPPLPFVQVVPHPVGVAPGWGDRDRDGVPNWRDRYDNRYDHRYDHRYHWHRARMARIDRDRDGVPDWRDPYDNRRGWGHDGYRDHDRHQDRDHDRRHDPRR